MYASCTVLGRLPSALGLADDRIVGEAQFNEPVLVRPRESTRSGAGEDFLFMPDFAAVLEGA